MPQEEPAHVNAGSGDGLSTPREASTTSILHIRRLPTCPLRSPREERTVVNAGSKECSRCELSVHMNDIEYQLPTPFTPVRRSEPHRAREEADRFVAALSASRLSPTLETSTRTSEDVSASAHNIEADGGAAQGTTSSPFQKASDAESVPVTAPSARPGVHRETSDPVLPITAAGAGNSHRPLFAVRPMRSGEGLATSPAQASRPVTRRRAYSLGAANMTHPPARARTLGSGDGGVMTTAATTTTTRRTNQRRPTSGGTAEERARRAALTLLTTETETTVLEAGRSQPVPTDPSAHATTREASRGGAVAEFTWYALSDESTMMTDLPAASSGGPHNTSRRASAVASPLPACVSVRGVWLDAATAIPESLTCEVCLHLAELPHTTDCGHLFCRDCLRHWLCDHPQCPTDRQPLRASQVRYDRRAERQIGALPCRCAGLQTPRACEEARATQPAASACTWTGCISDAARHMQRCPDAPVRCPFALYGCQTVTRRASLPAHVEASAASHNALLLQRLTALQERHHELLEEVDVLRPRVGATAASNSPMNGAVVAFAPMSGLSGLPSPAYLEPLPLRRRRHSSPTVTSLPVGPVPVVARYIWAITGVSGRLGQSSLPSRHRSNLLAPLPPVTSPTTATPTAHGSGPRLIYSPAFQSAPLPTTGELQEFMESSFSFSSLTSARAAGALEESRGSLPGELPPAGPTPAAAHARLQWYLGLASHRSMPDHDGGESRVNWDIYLFGHRHPYRTVFRLTVYHGTDPCRDIVHIVDDWQPAFMGKGWGPTNFIDAARLESDGFVVRDCLRVGVEIIGNPF